MASQLRVDADRSAGRSLVDLACGGCALRASRTQVVPAEGMLGAKLMLVGEGPGPKEDLQGRPFIGYGGGVLRRALQEAGVPLDAVWITNSVKCFPCKVEGGAKRIRKPLPTELSACLPHLAREVEALKATVAVALGSTALAQVTGRRGALGQVRGKWLEGRPELGRLRVLATFHPSGLHYGRGRREALVADLAAAYRLASLETSSG